MNFLNSPVLYFLPLALLPLLTLFIKRRSERIKLVSWLILLKDSELAKKRRFLKNLIIIMRCFILALLIIFIARPVPSKYYFSKIFFETGIYSQEVEKRNQENLKPLVSYYGKRMKTFCDPLDFSGDLRGKFYIVSDFSDPLLTQRFSSGFYYDTLSILNAGIRSLDFDPLSKSYYLTISNYNLEDTNLRLVIFKNSERVFESDLALPAGKNIIWKQDVGEESLLKVCLKVEDDIPSDNCIELSAPRSLRYYLAVKNIYIERFMKILGNETSADSADIIISFNRIVKPGERTKKVIIFFDKPMEQIKSITGTDFKEFGPVEVSGRYFENVFIFDTLKNFTDIKSFLLSTSRRVKVDNVLYEFIGFIPDIDKNEAVYCPDFWVYFLQILETTPAVVYTSVRDKAGKILNDTLYLQDTLQTQTGYAYIGDVHSVHLPLKYVVKDINFIRYFILSLLIGLVFLEFYLTYRYFAEPS
ncbi:MAG: hypothetical protein QMD82_03565 [bacterium]|nr:hypothetical protein [bacterium]